MSQRKNINHFFQEKFENHEVVPEPFIWQNIEIKLKEKKKRRIIPFWWKLSGIAAVVVIGFFIFNNLNPSNKISNIKIEQNNNQTITKSNIQSTTNLIQKENNAIIVKKEKIKTERNKKDINSINHTNINPSSANIIVDISTKKKTNSYTKLKHKSNYNVALENKNASKMFVKNNNITEVHSVLNQQESNEKNTTSADKVDFANQTNPLKSINAISNNNWLELNPKTEKPLIKKNDSTTIATVGSNALEELLIEKESKKVAEPKINRWQISTNIAPIYFSSTSEGSPLDNKLANNKKNYSAANFSYGIGINYALNKRVKIRTGVNMLSVDYDTHGILYYQSPNMSGKLSGLNPNVPGALLVIESMSNVNSYFKTPVQKFEGSINQKFGYIEMPLEVSYKIINKSFGVDIVGGVSTLVLNNNEVFLESSELSLKIGEANNLNHVHFSGNLGLGINYGFLKNLEARLEPVFKYQLNTFNNDAGNFKPFVFGIYTGINYTF